MRDSSPVVSFGATLATGSITTKKKNRFSMNKNVNKLANVGIVP